MHDLGLQLFRIYILSGYSARVGAGRGQEDPKCWVIPKKYVGDNGLMAKWIDGNR